MCPDDPRFRPPLALAVMAAAAKLVTTAWDGAPEWLERDGQRVLLTEVMDEPLLKSSAALNQAALSLIYFWQGSNHSCQEVHGLRTKARALFWPCGVGFCRGFVLCLLRCLGYCCGFCSWLWP